MSASLPAPRPAALDLSLFTCRVLVVGERGVLCVDFAPPETLAVFVLALFCGPDPFSSLFSSAYGRSYIVVGFIPCSTPLSERRRQWHHLTSEHRGQCSGGRCDVIVRWRTIGLHWIPEIYEQLSRIRKSKGTHEMLLIMLISSSGRKSDGSGAARLPSPISNPGGG